MPLNFLRDPNVGLKMKQLKKKIKAYSLARNTSRLGRCVKALRWDQDELISKSLR
jgi:hypothetical protein